MPSEEAHIRVANDNHVTLAFLLQDIETHLPWVGTVAFYKALHVVEAALDAGFGTHMPDHTSRYRFLANENRLKNVFKHYYPLYMMSQKARYLSNCAGKVRFVDHVDANDMINTYLKHHLLQVEQSAAKFLKGTPLISVASLSFT
jgi:hypothetical protein